MTSAIDSVLLIGFGGPTRPDEIRPYLQNVVRGRNVPVERLEAAARHYEAIGGRSPYNEWTFRQADALRAHLEADGLLLSVFVGMRNWHPTLAEAIAAMNREGCRRTVGIILAPHRSQTSWARYQLDVQRACDVNGGGPEILYLSPWHTDPLFLEAVASRVEEATGYQRGHWPTSVPLCFTAHSIPVSMAETSPYVQEIAQSAAGIATLLGAPHWLVAYQSRSGDACIPWLEPDVADALRAAAAEGVTEVVVVPVGFLCDHVEVLYDLDIEARETAAEVGVRFRRAGTVGDHPAFIQMLARRVRQMTEADHQ
ncbi:MAG: ferrochelatase [Armatimonadetes bacterium]|nr:ferrochelatase [Armatimonadota bacterium]